MRNEEAQTDLISNDALIARLETNSNYVLTSSVRKLYVAANLHTALLVLADIFQLHM